MKMEVDCFNYMFVVYIIVGVCCNSRNQPEFGVC